MQAGDLAEITSWTRIADAINCRIDIGFAERGEIVLILGRSESDNWYMRAVHPRLGLCQVFSAKLIPYREVK